MTNFNFREKKKIDQRSPAKVWSNLTKNDLVSVLWFYFPRCLKFALSTSAGSFPE